jgi:2-polyprenyl-6-methoxyphenol hydroxylase-like FAD-dependent oxidoreductase
VQLSDGQVLRGKLLVAADSRFSETRRAMGIGASMEDFGKTMLVCRMRHEGRHEHVAWEWFGSSQTLALLPLNEYESSVVLTLPHAQVQRLMSTDESAFNIELSQRFEQRLGAMQLTSTRHAYPLVGVYPHKFTGTRFALVGDAAVGMHPVTAHGFNFGLLGQDLLSKAILDAHHRGTEISADGLLSQYERRLWRATRRCILPRAPSSGSTPTTAHRRVWPAKPDWLWGARISPFRRMLAAGFDAERQQSEQHEAGEPLPCGRWFHANSPAGYCAPLAGNCGWCGGRLIHLNRPADVRRYSVASFPVAES